MGEGAVGTQGLEALGAPLVGRAVLAAPGSPPPAQVSVLWLPLPVLSKHHPSTLCLVTYVTKAPGSALSLAPLCWRQSMRNPRGSGAHCYLSPALGPAPLPSGCESVVAAQGQGKPQVPLLLDGIQTRHHRALSSCLLPTGRGGGFPLLQGDQPCFSTRPQPSRSHPAVSRRCHCPLLSQQSSRPHLPGWRLVLTGGVPWGQHPGDV